MLNEQHLVSAVLKLLLFAWVVEASAEEVQYSGLPEPPAEALVAAISFTEDAATNRVTLDLSKDGHKPLILMLDTGASFSVMTPGAARAAGISIRRTKNTPYRRPTRLGRDLQFRIDTSSSDTGSRTGWDYGLIGGNFLEQYVVEFDFTEQRVRFFDSKKLKLPKSVDAPSEAIVPLRVIGKRPFVEVQLNGGKLWVMLDTGAEGAMVVSGKTAEKAGVDLSQLAPFGVYQTVRGSMPVSLYETKSLRLGPFEFDETPVMVAPRGWYNQGGTSDSVIGYDILRQFKIRLDYKRQRAWFKRESTTSTYMSVDYALVRKTGMFMLPEDNVFFYARWVRPGSPSADLGVMEGDYLVRSYGDTRIDMDSLADRIVAGKKIRVTRRAGDDVWLDMILPDDRDLQTGTGE